MYVGLMACYCETNVINMPYETDADTCVGRIMTNVSVNDHNVGRNFRQFVMLSLIG